MDKMSNKQGGATAEALKEEDKATRVSAVVRGQGEDIDEDYYNSTSSALSDDRWDEMFKRLLDFKEVHGHCLVPNRYKEDLQLGAWVSGQRKNYKLLQAGSGKTTPMTMERARRLMDVGFEWTAKNPRHLMWEVRFAELKDFKNSYGHAQVPIGWEQNVQLANWVSTQRQEYKNLIRNKTSRLNDKRVQMLESLGFAWELQRGGRRRRLAVNKGGNKDTPGSGNPPHPADQEDAEGGLSPPANQPNMQQQNMQQQMPPPEDKFAIDDGSTPVKARPGGRKRTTLKKKVTAVDGPQKCILPGVAILGGGREIPGRSVNVNQGNQRRMSSNAPQADTSGSAPNMGPMGGNGQNMNGNRPLQAQQNMQQGMQQQYPQQPNNQFNNEALIRALQSQGNMNAWQLLPNGAYQQNAHPLAHLMGGAMGGGHPFFPMAPNPFGMQMNPFGNPNVMNGGSPFPPQANNNNGNVGNNNNNMGYQGDGSNNSGMQGNGNNNNSNNGMNPQDVARMQMQQAAAFGQMGGPQQQQQQQQSPFNSPSSDGNENNGAKQEDRNSPMQQQQNNNSNNNGQQQQQQQQQMQNQGMGGPMGGPPNQFGGGNGGWGQGGGGMQGPNPLWNMSEGAARVAAATQHLQACATLTAGLDERCLASLPPGLAQVAKMTRHMNGGMPGALGGGNGDSNGQGGQGGHPMMGMNMGMGMPGPNGAAPGVGPNPMMGGMGGMGGMGMGGMGGNNNHMMNNMAAQQQQARSRRGDPPADPPSGFGGGNGGLMPDGSLGQPNRGSPNNNKRKMPGQGGDQQQDNDMMKKMKQDIFDDADEGDQEE